ncbi:MAG TPA: pirin family protein [Puia sp.]|jgi:redox-sensitive bicupin YhaK (pirin superfamily)|nr:pirin family protein [Puia sp.]
MSNTILHKAASRGHADHGWLNSYQSFSFASYYNPERTQFGVLRVLNDDVVTGGKGFGSHPHDNMEIISIPLEGALVHEDNMGHKEVVSAGEIQVMSTGSGVFHSEYNNSPDKPAKFLQIWLFPNKLNVTPRYDQVKLDPLKGENRLQQLIAPRGVAGDEAAGEVVGEKGIGEGTWIYQDAWFFSGRFDKERQISYERKKKENGVYLFVIKGSFAVDGQRLDTRDGLGVTDLDSIGIQSLEEGSEILIMDVPMKNKIQ